MLFSKYISNVLSSVSLKVSSVIFSSLSNLPKSYNYYSKISKKNYMFTESNNQLINLTKPGKSTEAKPSSLLLVLSNNLSSNYDLHALKYSLLV